MTRWRVSPWPAVSGGAAYLYRVMSQPASAVRAPRRRAQVPPDQAFSAGTILPPRAHLATSGETFGCDNWGTECCWHRVCRELGAAHHPVSHRPGATAQRHGTKVSTVLRSRALLCAYFGFPIMSRPHRTRPPPRQSGERRGLPCHETLKSNPKSEGASGKPQWARATPSH